MTISSWMLRAMTIAGVATLAACGLDAPSAPKTDVAPSAPSPEPSDELASDDLVVQLGDDLSACRAGARARASRGSRAPPLRRSGRRPRRARQGHARAGARRHVGGASGRARCRRDVAPCRGLVLRSAPLGKATALAMRGSHATSSKVTTHGEGNLATAFGAYAALEELGFGFLHPLAPTRPTKLEAITSLCSAARSRAGRSAASSSTRCIRWSSRTCSRAGARRAPRTPRAGPRCCPNGTRSWSGSSRTDRTACTGCCSRRMRGRPSRRARYGTNAWRSS